MAKTTIIVRSVVVMRDNLTANLLQLHMNGMSLVDIPRKMFAAFTEITEYTRNKDRMLTLERQFTSAIAKKNPDEAQRMRAKISALEDANAKMKIQPLIKAGEFNTISESLTEADIAIRYGKFGDGLETGLFKKIFAPIPTIRSADTRASPAVCSTAVVLAWDPSWWHRAMPAS